eukprot:TRINITY_DN4660_c0_g4_i2.p1 TRINITY_DN4660_c0_g4~~TRINITY_DN4660_c0_g4_i2.p1  ORF type:complete len:189 (+),score=24.08 TRINITY_DN4660_c0_g4_i2:247-813(+)
MINHWYMGFALLAMRKSPDRDLKVGAVLCYPVLKEEHFPYEIIGLGYNGQVRNAQSHQFPMETSKTSPDPLKLKHNYVIHAEQNALLYRRSKIGSKLAKCLMFVTMSPCDKCFPVLKELGIEFIIAATKGKHSKSLWSAKEILEIDEASFNKIKELMGRETSEVSNKRQNSVPPFSPPPHDGDSLPQL